MIRGYHKIKEFTRKNDKWKYIVKTTKINFVNILQTGFIRPHMGMLPSFKNSGMWHPPDFTPTKKKKNTQTPGDTMQLDSLNDGGFLWSTFKLVNPKNQWSNWTYKIVPVQTYTALEVTAVQYCVGKSTPHNELKKWHNSSLCFLIRWPKRCC